MDRERKDNQNNSKELSTVERELLELDPNIFQQGFL